tara:strand:- start:1397 stop:1684 length:288 start_codon:yes stop_codon:yes gene_type:complete
MFSRLDANNNGKLEKNELPGGLQRLLERGDSNKDGAIDREELQKALRSRSGRSPQAGSGPRGPGRGGRPERPAPPFPKKSGAEKKQPAPATDVDA